MGTGSKAPTTVHGEPPRRTDGRTSLKEIFASQPPGREPPSPAIIAASDETTTVRRAAFLAGGALLLLSALAGFGNVVVVQGLVTPSDAAATAGDITGSLGLFRFGIASLYVVVVLDVVVAWALMRVFSTVSKDLSRLDAWFRLAYSGVFLVAVSQLAGIPQLLSTGGDASGLSPQQVQGQALAKFEAFHDIWMAALILFGAHLSLTGYLALTSSFMPRLIGALLVVAGAGYAFDSFFSVFTDTPPFVVSNVTFLGEFLLGLWLLFRSRHMTRTGPAS